LVGDDTMRTNAHSIADGIDSEYDVTCAIEGDMLIREYTFGYATPQWNPRVMK
jgi:hypothetical protein